MLKKYNRSRLSSQRDHLTQHCNQYHIITINKIFLDDRNLFCSPTVYICFNNDNDNEIILLT